MRNYITLYFVLSISFLIAQTNENVWKSNLDFGEGAIFSTFLNIENTKNQYLITSPKNADARIFGGFKARLGRLLGKSPKKGVLLKIDTKKIGDSLFGNTTLPIFGKLKFKGILTQHTLSGEFIKNDSIVIGSLKGLKSKETSISYASLYPKILNITKDNIYSKQVLESKDWRKFQNNLNRLCKKAEDDIEFFIGFSMLNSSLPFSHYNIFIEDKLQEKNIVNESLTRESTVIFEEKNPNTAYIKIKNFSTTQKELSIVLPKITENKNYKNLIVDLRNNGGGGIDAAFELAKHIAVKDIEVGYFITNKLRYSGFQPKLFETLPELHPKSTEEFGNDLKTGRGAKLVFRKSDNKIYSGNLYVLTNNNTGSTCEPIVYALKNTLNATVIGEKTAGAMLAATWFNLDSKYLLMLPIADFYTYDGERLDQNGVNPTIEIASERALEKALEIINNNP
ncbi:S41 family peptidase [Lacinutrix chionoecetis]